MNLHATVNGKPALYSHETGELWLLPPNIKRFVDDQHGHVEKAVDQLGRPVIPDWLPALKTDEIKIFYTVKNVHQEWREEYKFKIRT